MAESGGGDGDDCSAGTDRGCDGGGGASGGGGNILFRARCSLAGPFGCGCGLAGDAGGDFVTAVGRTGLTEMRVVGRRACLVCSACAFAMAVSASAIFFFFTSDS